MENKLLWFSAFLIITMGADFLSTQYGINHGIQEGNPLMVDIVHNATLFFIVKAIGTIFIIISIAWCFRKNENTAVIGMKVIGILMLLVLFNNAFVIAANAESGTIYVNSSQSFGTEPTSLAAAGANHYNQLMFDTANWNTITSFEISFSLTANPYILESNSSNFLCDSPNTCEGIVSYSKSGNWVSWDFYPGSTIKTSPVTLTYEENIFDANNFLYINDSSAVDANEAAGGNIPVCIYNTQNKCAFGKSGAPPTVNIIALNSTVGVSTHVRYNITYPVEGKFSGNLSKDPGVSTKVRLNDFANQSTYFVESGFNTANTTFPLMNYGNQLYANVTTAAGSYNLVLINSTGNASGTIDTETWVRWYDDENYDQIFSTLIGSKPYLRANIGTKNWATNFHYQIDVYDANGQYAHTHYFVPGNSQLSVHYTDYFANPNMPLGFYTAYLFMIEDSNPNYYWPIGKMSLQLLKSAGLPPIDNPFNMSNATGNISFNQTTYELGQIANVSFNITFPDYDNFVYGIQLLDPHDNIVETGMLPTNTVIFPYYTETSIPFSEPGVWEVQLFSCGYGICWANKKIIATDTAIVFGGASNSTLNYQSAYVKSKYRTYFNNSKIFINFGIQYNATAQQITDISHRIDLIDPNNVVLNSFTPFQLCEQVRFYDPILFPNYRYQCFGLSKSINADNYIYDQDQFWLDVSNSKDISFLPSGFWTNGTHQVKLYEINKASGTPALLSSDSFDVLNVSGTLTPGGAGVEGTGKNPNEPVDSSGVISILSNNTFWAFIITAGLMIGMGALAAKDKFNPVVPMVMTGMLGLGVFSMLGWMPLWITGSVILAVIVAFAWQQATNTNTGGSN